MRKILALFAASSLFVAAAVTSTQAASHRRPAVKHKLVHGLVAPRLLTPAGGAQVEQVPTLTWTAVAVAADYEYQLSADPRFNSIALGSGSGTGTSITHNLAAALSKSIVDGTY